MSGVADFFSPGRKKKRAPDPARELELSRQRRASIIQQGRRQTVLTPLSGDATVGTTLVVGR